jgi:hypothetical protein
LDKQHYILLLLFSIVLPPPNLQAVSLLTIPPLSHVFSSFLFLTILFGATTAASSTMRLSVPLLHILLYKHTTLYQLRIGTSSIQTLPAALQWYC